MNENIQEDLWDFATRTYALPGVSEACLSLQDEQGVDVPILLFSLWLAANNAALSEAGLLVVDRRMHDWRKHVIWPLRNIRRHLKSGPSPAPSEETEEVRQAVKAAELRAERVELSVLEAEGRILLSRAEQAQNVHLENAFLVVRHYGGCEPSLRPRAAIDVVLKAMLK